MSLSTPAAPAAAAELFRRTGAECGRLIAGRDWSTSPLGPLDAWPQSLITATVTLLCSPVPIVMLWGEHGVMLYNDPYSLFAGGRHPELLGSNVREGWPEVADFNDHVMKVGLAGDTLSYKDQELTLYRHGVPEQVWMNLDYSPIYDESRVPAGVFCILAETTERVKADAALHELNETLEAQVAERAAERDRLWDLSQDMLARADYTGMMSAVSPAWTRVLGWREDELLTRPYASFMHDEDMPPTLAAIGRMSENRQPARFENRIATADGGWKHIEWTVAPEADGENFIAVGRDLSDAKARETELQVAQEALRQSQKMEALGQLTGGIAHDFNNLLTPIIGALDVLRRHDHTPRNGRLLDGALVSADRAKVLIARLLSFARKQRLEDKEVGLQRLLIGMTDLIGKSLGPTIQLELQPPPAGLTARIDPNQLELALLNLAVNARDAMEAGGRLRIAVSEQKVTGAHPASLAPGDYVRIDVHDDGHGMTPETLRLAIEPFYSTKEVGKGTGLGLSMVHGLAAQSGGGLSIDSAVGEGTTVSLWVPRGSGQVDEPVRDGIEIGETRPRRILLVDDEELVRAATAEMLRDAGHRVDQAHSGAAALEKLRDDPGYEVLVTDYAMPQMTGAALIRAARTLAPALPALLVTGYASETSDVPAEVPRIEKPFRSAELLSRIAQLDGSIDRADAG
ncbi:MULTISPECIES: hybrid sensor histidine kinase/response regulator [Sphingomonas]|uniref:hybrid sensor histidine kinase/response regulator n=1 Tax=Sphingomonas TaxID=13687 RepID=UPI000DEEBDF5|nr:MULTISPECIES: hybrid sensor histidine kinase/response regulator [Sphingomonas]